MAAEVKDFDPTISQSEVDRLWRKLKDTRIPEHPVVPDAGDDYGPPLEWIQKLYSYWTNDFDWSAAQHRISSWKHHTTDIAGLTIHFVHQPSPRADAIPLLLVHGWPGTWYEFSRCINELSSPESEDTPAFHCVVPSLPGFAWSSGPPRDWTLQETARIFDTLMARVGYSRYVAQGGDWGHWVVRELGAHYYQRCKAVHTNLCPSVPPVESKAQWTQREKTAQTMTDWWLGVPGNEMHMGYAIEMRTRPQTIGMALTDSPLGIMMWVGEKYYELVDPRYRSLDDTRMLDDVCTTLCLYFFTSPSIMTSALCYTNNVRHEDYVEFNTRKENMIKVPFGFSSFRYDITPVSKRAAETTGNCQWFREHDHGGHFAALEVPTEFVEDLRDCFSKLYPSS
ncbi:Alpha/Beta hydrolase protein [Xylariomycetidae sp. FL0641]|nr:Alpha/Beta hydrolase protein [Xylariomycetidae sp. FL0641]